MSDQFTSVEGKGLGTNLVDAIKGVAVGGLLFICSFIVLWMNKGRVDPSEVAKKSVVANPASVDSSLNGKFVSVTGDLKGSLAALARVSQPCVACHAAYRIR